MRKNGNFSPKSQWSHDHSFRKKTSKTKDFHCSCLYYRGRLTDKKISKFCQIHTTLIDFFLRKCTFFVNLHQVFMKNGLL